MAADDKSRKERRKEARQAKSKNKFDSWLQHQQSSKSKRDQYKVKLHKLDANKDSDLLPQKLEESKYKVKGFKTKKGLSKEEQPQNLVISDVKRKNLKRKKDSSKSSESNFSKYLKMETVGKFSSAYDDLRFERRLAKKLKVKNGRLSAAGDDVDILLEDITSTFDTLVECEQEHDEVSLDDSEKLEDEIFEDNGEDEEDDTEDLDNEEDSEDDTEDLDNEGDSEDEISANEESDALVADTDDNDDCALEKIPSLKKSDKVKRRTSKFEEYLESDMQGGQNSAEVDLALERKLRKRLKLKSGVLHGEDDMNMLLEGIPSVLGYPKKSIGSNESHGKSKDSNQTDQQKAVRGSSSNTGISEPVASAKYVAPHLRSQRGNDSEEVAQARKRIRGLLNRLSENNVESITGEISNLLNSIGRGTGSQIISEEVVSSCSGGPRGNEQYAAVFAAFVAGMACSVGMDFGAKLLALVAKCFEEEYLKEDNLSLRNLTLLLSYLYVFGVCSSELIYDFLITLSKRLTEVDISTILAVLQCCGMKLRGDDPAGMKNFISSIRSMANEVKATPTDGQANTINKRVEFMLDTICNIKNNRQKPKEDTVQLTRMKKWLQKLTVDNILIQGLKWSKLVDPNKKGQWWLSGDLATSTTGTENVEEVAVKIDKEIPETKKMLQLAASQRMNTDARRAIFCVIMSGDDYIDAFEKLQRIELQGKQDREIMRVLVDCCLQEKVFNKYYSVLAWKLCSHDKNHKFTLQYCLWDQFKELESMPLIRSMHLSKFTAEMVSSFSLSLSVLKAVDLNDLSQLTPKKIMHFRMLFEAIFEFKDKIVWKIFTRIASNPEYESLRTGIKFFISNYVVSSEKSLSSKFKVAKKALSSVEGDMM